MNELYGELRVCFAKKNKKMKPDCSGKDTCDLRFCCTVASPPQNFSLNSYGMTARPFQQYMFTKTAVTALHEPVEKFEMALILS